MCLKLNMVSRNLLFGTCNFYCTVTKRHIYTILPVVFPQQLPLLDLTERYACGIYPGNKNNESSSICFICESRNTYMQLDTQVCAALHWKCVGYMPLKSLQKTGGGRGVEEKHRLCGAAVQVITPLCQLQFFHYYLIKVSSRRLPNLLCPYLAY